MELKLSNCNFFVSLTHSLIACPHQSTYRLNYCVYSLHSLLGQSLFPSAQTFLVMVSLSLVSGMSAFLHDGYIAAIENCCVPMVVKCTLYVHSVIAVRCLVQHNVFYVHNVIVIRHFIQHEVVATELYT